MSSVRCLAFLVSLVAAMVVAIVPDPAVAETDQEWALRALELIDEELREHPDLPEAERQSLLERRRFFDGLSRAKPAPVPPTAAHAEGTDPGELISYDVATGRVTRSAPSVGGANRPVKMEGFAGEIPQGVFLEDGGDFSADSQLQGGCGVPGPDCTNTAYPDRTVCKMLMRFNVGGTNYFYVCSAATIAKFTFLTAAHCIYNHDPNGSAPGATPAFANELWLWPGQGDHANPFGTADWPYGLCKVTNQQTWTAWTNNEDLNWDIAWLAGEMNMGDRVGWMGLETGTTTTLLNFDGYPTETPYVPAGTICDYLEQGNNLNYTSNRIGMCAYVYGGHSGGPNWRYDGTNRYIQGVNSTSNRMGSATATRLTSTTTDQIFDNFIPGISARVNRPELIEYVFNNTSKDLLSNSVAQGQTFQMEYNAYNVGFASTGTITVDFYLSTNTIISTGDRLVGSASLSSIAANTFYNPTATLTVPCSVPTGTYYGGWIMRCTGTEYHEEGSADDNNVVVIADETITVTTALTASVPALVSPSNGATCVSTTVTVDWNPSANGSTYQVQLGTSCGSGTIYSTGGATSRLYSGLAPNTTYYWRARALNVCGTAGSWSSCRSFTTTPATPGIAALVSPANGASCQSTTVTLDWNAVANATAYQVQIGTSCGTGTTYATSATARVVSGLATSTTYFWRVRAQNACGTYGFWSSCRSFTTTPPAPGIASLLSPADAATCVATTTSLDWSDVTNANAYEVQIGTSCGTGTITLVATSNHTATGLANGTQYYWRVRGRNACGTFGAWSGCRSFTTIPNPPGIATLVSPVGGACAGSTTNINWDDVPGAASYEVQIGTSCGTGTIVTVTPSNYVASGLSGGIHHWRVRARDACGQFGAWTACETFDVDLTPPVNPALSSSSHATSTWSNDNTVDVQWSGASDNCGIRAYSILWDGNPTTMPDMNPETAGEEDTSPPLEDGDRHWFHLRTQDAYDNWSDAVHLGPFWIDTTPPTNPNATSPSHTASAWSTDNTIDAAWEGASDRTLPDGDEIARLDGKHVRKGGGNVLVLKGGSGMQLARGVATSGIAGYSIVWDTNPGTVPDGTPETAATSATSPPRPDGQSHYFHVRTVDNAGNIAVGAEHIGPFWIDATPPSDPATFVTSPDINDWVNQDNLSVQWSDYSDNLSGVDGFSILFDLSAATVPDQVVDPTPGDQATLGPPIADGEYFFHIRTKDVAGNWTSTAHVGPLQIDQTPPNAVLIDPNGAESWMCTDTETISWKSTDATSGIASLELRYSTDGGATYPNLIANPAPGESTYDWLVPDDETTTARVRVFATDRAGNTDADASNGDFELVCGITTVGGSAQPVTRYELEASRPNPFRGSTLMRFAVLEDTPVELVVLDVHGRRVRTLVDRTLSGPNRYESVWDGRDDSGRSMGSGVYFYRLETKAYSKTRRLTLLR